MTNKYKFNKERHLHQILIDEEWRNLTGCTTVLNVLAKPALIQWSANMTANFLRDKLEDIKKLKLTEFRALLDEARKAHCKRKKKGGDYGKKIHSIINVLISEAITSNKGYIQRARKYKEKSVQNFIDWAIQNKVRFLETEKNIYSEPLFIGGIVDFVCEIGGKIWIGDIKTSKSGIYPENFWQCGGYNLMLRDMDLYSDITGYLILNLKESGEMLEKRSINNKDNKKAFMACLTIYRLQEKLKANTIN